MAGDKGYNQIVIYSNDGSTWLGHASLGDAYLSGGHTDYVYISNEGLTFDGSLVYKYVSAGGKYLIGFATTPNATVPDCTSPIAVGAPGILNGEIVYLYVVEGVREEEEEPPEVPAPEVPTPSGAPAATVNLYRLNLSGGVHSITVRSKATGYADSLDSNVVEYTMPIFTLSGTWVIEGLKTPVMNIQEAVSFTSNGTDYSLFGVTMLKNVFYDDTAVCNMSFWTNAAYRTVTFDGEQQVSRMFHEWFTSSAQPASGGNTPEETTYSLSGAWLFYQVPTLSTRGVQDVRFVSNGVLYSYIDYRLRSIFYNDTLAYTTEPQSPGDSDEPDWQDEAYRTITFDGAQTVSEDFYNWFTDNAIKQEEATYALSGTWMFNKVIADHFPPENLVYFTSNGTHFSPSEHPNYKSTIYNAGQDYVTYAGINVYDDDAGVWLDDAYRIITFHGEQTVNEEFYTWFTSNAQPAISGTWLFNEVPSFETIYAGINVHFVSNSRSFDRITVGHGYIEYEDTSSFEEVYDNVDGWDNEAYRTVDFGDTPQSMPEGAYEWLTSNAQPVIKAGAYKFNDVLWANNSGEFPHSNVRFVSDGEVWAGMTTIKTRALGYIIAGDTDSVMVYGYGWEKDAYKTITKSYDTEVSLEFYEWFTDNTTKQT